MANTLHGPFVKGASLSTGSYGTGTGQVNTYTSGNANNDETQSAVALHSFNPDLLSAFVLSGITCTKDGTTASQLDVASGVAYLTQSDGSLARCDVASTTFSTSGNLSTTMYLDLNPDGSWSWATSHSAVTNHLTICSVVTDASGNISTVTDARVTSTTLLPGFTSSNYASVGMPNVILLGGAVGGTHANMFLYPAAGGGDNSFHFQTVQSGAASGYTFSAWDGSALKTNLQIGYASTGISTLGGQATAGSFGVPVIVAQAINTHVTATTQQTILSYTVPTTGNYRITNTITLNNGTSGQSITDMLNWTDGNTGSVWGQYFTANTGSVTNLHGVSIANGSYTPFPVMVYAQAASTITVNYTDPAGTPNDYVSAIIERLS